MTGRSGRLRLELAASVPRWPVSRTIGDGVEPIQAAQFREISFAGYLTQR